MRTNEIHVLARAVVIDNGHLLLCKALARDPQFYFLPGGHVEHEEQAEQALLRELHEESGHHFDIVRFLGCFEYLFVPEKRVPCHTHEYNLVFQATAKNLDATMLVPQPEERIALEWVPITQLEQIDFRPVHMRPLLGQWIAGISEKSFCSVVDASFHQR